MGDENFIKERYARRLKALPKFLNDHETEGRGMLWSSKGGGENITFAATFSEYGEKMKEDLWSTLQRHIESNERPVRIADIGCGRGDAMREVKERYNEEIITIGFELARLRSHQFLDRLVIGNFEKDPLPPCLKGMVDMVVSDQVFRYFLNPFGEPQKKVYEMLKPEGTGHIDVFACDFPKERECYDISPNSTLTITK